MNKTVIFIALGILGAIAVGFFIYRKAQWKKSIKPKPVEYTEK